MTEGGGGGVSGCVGTDGLSRLLVLLVDLGVCPLGLARTTSHSLQSSSPT